MELLNGKAKELFEKWLENQEVAPYKAMFYDIPIIVQQSYIIEWLDSVGIYVNIENLHYQSWWYYNLKKCPDTYKQFVMCKTREEATTEAIKKAVELINESNGN